MQVEYDSVIDETLDIIISKCNTKYDLDAPGDKDELTSFLNWYLEKHPEMLEAQMKRMESSRSILRGYPTNVLVEALFAYHVLTGRVDVSVRTTGGIVTKKIETADEVARLSLQYNPIKKLTAFLAITASKSTEPGRQIPSRLKLFNELVTYEKVSSFLLGDIMGVSQGNSPDSQSKFPAAQQKFVDYLSKHLAIGPEFCKAIPYQVTYQRFPNEEYHFTTNGSISGRQLLAHVQKSAALAQRSLPDDLRSNIDVRAFMYARDVPDGIVRFSSRTDHAASRSFVEAFATALAKNTSTANI